MSWGLIISTPASANRTASTGFFLRKISCCTKGAFSCTTSDLSKNVTTEHLGKTGKTEIEQISVWSDYRSRWFKDQGSIIQKDI